jgi:hypothetical protein
MQAMLRRSHSYPGGPNCALPPWPKIKNFISLSFGNNSRMSQSDQIHGGNFETAKASNFNKLQQLSTSGLQAVQHQTVTILEIPQVSISPGIWFGTRGSEVQILSPRPIHFNNLENLSSFAARPRWECTRWSSVLVCVNIGFREEGRCSGCLKIAYR